MAYGQGGWRRRRRNIYSLTGMPRWIRFGYSPDRASMGSTGLPVTEQYLEQRGQMPQLYPEQSLAQTSVPTHEVCANFRDGFCMLYGAKVDPGGPACPSFTPTSYTMAPKISSMQSTFQLSSGFPLAQVLQISKEQEIQMLKEQARMMEQRLGQIKRRFEGLG
ncbi:MAG: DUF5320 domain-containing protein [Candidatus Hadarchaeaceae archaeon]